MKREIRQFIFDGKSSLDFKIDLTGVDAYGIVPEREVEQVSVEGRNGDLIIDKGSYKNVDIKYGCKIWNRHDPAAFRAYFDAFADFIGNHQGTYYKLEDSYHPEEFTYAMIKSGIEPDFKENAGGVVYAEFDLEMTRKPQRWLKSGQNWTTATSLRNPTSNEARPLIRVVGSGTLTVGSETITIASNSLSYIDIDCDLRNSFCGTTNANSYITISNDYPVLGNGTTKISSTGLTSVQIKPRWWRL